MSGLGREAQFRANVLRAIEENRELLAAVEPQLHANIRELLRADAFLTDAWLISGCGYLYGQRPIDVLPHDPQVVLNAARDADRGIQHG